VELAVFDENSKQKGSNSLDIVGNTAAVSGKGRNSKNSSTINEGMATAMANS